MSTQFASIDRSSAARQSEVAEVAAPLASLGKSSVIHRSGDAKLATAAAAADSVEHKPELLYAIEFTVASAREGDKTVRLLAEVNKNVGSGVCRSEETCLLGVAGACWR